MGLPILNPLDLAKRAWKRAAKAFEPLFRETGEKVPTQREMRLDTSEYTVKQALGPSWFTRQLSAKTRWARLSELTPEERAIAREKGWLDVTPKQVARRRARMTRRQRRREKA